MAKVLTIEYVREQVRLLSDSELLSAEYVNNTTPLRFRCSCGTEFSRPWIRFREGHTKCFSCGTKEQYEQKRLGLSEVKSRLGYFGVTYVSGVYKNQKSKLSVTYSCGHPGVLTYNTTFNSSFTGECPSCRRSNCQRLDILTVSITSEFVYGVDLLSEEYVDAHSPLLFRCSCGETFETSWNNFLTGKRRCDFCSKRVSRGEFAIVRWLEEKGIRFERQKRFLDCADRRSLPFGFFIPDANLCIEFDGYQHYRPVEYWKGDPSYARIKAHDAMKTAYCEAVGIELLRIPYTEIDNIDDILSSKLIPR